VSRTSNDRYIRQSLVSNALYFVRIFRPSLSPVADNTVGIDHRTESAHSSVAVLLERVEHYFGHRHVIRTVSAHIESGQVCVVSGANGAGKSTLMRIVAGLLKPSGGTSTITVQGQMLDSLARRRFLGYVSPDLMLYRELTAAENLQFFARLRGKTLGRDESVERLTQVGLQGRGRDLVGTYSSGMRQRLKYAFALLDRPPILLLDEPTANLDGDGIRIVEGVIATQRERAGGGLTIVATNEPREMEWGDLRIHLEANR
jgi:heme exporter protein A